jgi:hypothetical protein
MSVSQMFVGKMSVVQTSFGQKSAVKMSFRQLFVGKMSVIQMSLELIVFLEI